MYALEHDPTGTFGRQGSIYDLLADAKQKTARLAINAWGLSGNYGEYTADSRSVDQFVKDESSLLPIFSVGDWDGTGSSMVTLHATAKMSFQLVLALLAAAVLHLKELLTKYPGMARPCRWENKARRCRSWN